MIDPILITGVGKRIGLALAKKLVASGYPVLGTYRTPYPAIDELKTLGVKLYQVDFYNPFELQELVDKLRDEHPRLRAIIHNASDWMPDDSRRPEYILDSMMQIHVQVPYQLNTFLADALKATAAENADIIHISDYVSEKGSKKHIAYAASKAALSNLTLSFSALLAPKVKVNEIAPAMIMFNPEDKEVYREKALAKSLMGIAPGEQEVVEAVEYILSSRYMTGRTIKLDGGRHLK
ncbi:MAG: dihydromonapterin reductase [Pontibacterium sp.]